MFGRKGENLDEWLEGEEKLDEGKVKEDGAVKEKAEKNVNGM